MTDTWDSLYDRASAYDVSTDDVRTSLEAVRNGENGGTSGGTDASSTDATDAGGDDA